METDVDTSYDQRYMLLVPDDQERLSDVSKMNDTIRATLAHEGAVVPLANINLGAGRMCSFGIGSGGFRNQRAMDLLATWADTHIALHGPVVFSGLTAAEVVDLVRRSQPPKIAAVPG